MSNRPTKPAQKHHTTPAGYLRRFYEPGSETLYRYENGTDMIVTRSHRSFGWVRHYHTITTGDGTRDSEVVEKYVNATFEGPGYAALEKVEARQPLTEDDRFALAQFIGFLAVRVPKAKEGVAESVGQTVADMLSMLAS